MVGVDDVYGDEGRVPGCGGSAAAGGYDEQEAGEVREEGRAESAVSVKGYWHVRYKSLYSGAGMLARRCPHRRPARLDGLQVILVPQRGWQLG